MTGREKQSFALGLLLGIGAGLFVWFCVGRGAENPKQPTPSPAPPDPPSSMYHVLYVAKTPKGNLIVDTATVTSDNPIRTTNCVAVLREFIEKSRGLQNVQVCPFPLASDQ